MKRFGITLAGALLAVAAPAAAGDDPLLRPIAPEQANQWLTPQPPVKIHGNTYLVGFGGLNVTLIETSAGLVLVDGAVPQAVPQIEANIERLGFALDDVRLILSTEPHYDHAGGLAALARDTGATVVASREAAAVLRRGQSGPNDPQMAWLPSFPSVDRIRVVRDREEIRLGNVTITARATPGHTPGSMSWTWRSCEGERCADVVFASSLSPLAADGYLFSDPDHSEAVAAFRRTFEVLRGLDCDILLTSHPDASGGDVKLARLREGREPNPFLDPQACRAYADTYAGHLEERLAREAQLEKAP